MKKCLLNYIKIDTSHILPEEKDLRGLAVICETCKPKRAEGMRITSKLNSLLIGSKGHPVIISGINNTGKGIEDKENLQKHGRQNHIIGNP